MRVAGANILSGCSAWWWIISMPVTVELEPEIEDST
jgi:hypothetical protein